MATGNEPDGNETLIGELRSLRRGSGLTPSRAARLLRDKPLILAALQCRDPLLAFERLKLEVSRLPETIETRAVRNALNLDGMLKPLLAQRSLAFYATELQIVADVELNIEHARRTVLNWENRGFDELAARITEVERTGVVNVVATVRRCRLESYAVFKTRQLFEYGDDGSLALVPGAIPRIAAMEFDSEGNEQPTMPLIAYRWDEPQDSFWLTIWVHFLDMEPPDRIFAGAARDLFDMATMVDALDKCPINRREAPDRWEVEFHVTRPADGAIYFVTWSGGSPHDASPDPGFPWGWDSWFFGAETAGKTVKVRPPWRRLQTRPDGVAIHGGFNET